MSRKIMLQLVLPLIGLSVLFWLLAFAPSGKHRRPALLEMSVILRDGDGTVSAMRKGMEQAAMDLNVELRFLTPSEDNGAAEQAQLLQREAEDAEAIVLIPADRETLGDAVSAAAEKTTLVTVETDMSAWGAAASVSMDHRALGEALGAAALNGVPAGETVLLLDSLPGDNGVRESLDAARAVLEEAGRQVRIGAWGADSASLDNAAGAERPSAVIAFEASALADMAELARGEKRFPLLYGKKIAQRIILELKDKLAKGQLPAGEERYGGTGVTVIPQNKSSEATAALARHERWTDVPSVAFSVVRKETMYDSDNQKLLFPVT